MLPLAQSEASGVDEHSQIAEIFWDILLRRQRQKPLKVKVKEENPTSLKLVEYIYQHAGCLP